MVVVVFHCIVLWEREEILGLDGNEIIRLFVIRERKEVQ